jgi:DNA-directed RNA polymerase specialized sigma24 family protein
MTEPEAFGIFYRRHVRGVLSFFRRRVRSAALAFELTAETFATALDVAPRYRPRPEPARGWLYGIAWGQLDAGRSADAQADEAVGGAPPPSGASIEDPIALLERELVDAARRRAGQPPRASALLSGRHAEDEDPLGRQEALQDHREGQSVGPALLHQPHLGEEVA